MTSATQVVILGAGGLGREILQHIRDMQAFGSELQVVGFLDDNPAALNNFEVDVPIMGRIDSNLGERVKVVIALGEPQLRRESRLMLDSRGVELQTVRHPSAWVAPSAQLGAGSMIGPGVFVGVNSFIGRNVLLNVYASVGHDARIGQDSALSSYTALTGKAGLGEGCFTGTHVTVTPGVSVGGWSKISAGAVVTKDALPGSLVIGNPAKSRVIYRDSSAEVRTI